MEVTGIYLYYMSTDSGIYKWPKLLKFIRIHNFIKYLRLPKLLRQQKDKGEILKTIFGRPPLRQSKVFYFTYKLQNCFFCPDACIITNLPVTLMVSSPALALVQDSFMASTGVAKLISSPEVSCSSRYLLARSTTFLKDFYIYSEAILSEA